MTKKHYEIVINQTFYAHGDTRQEAKENLAEELHEAVDWNDVTIKVIE
jgi:predicted RNase H-like HicB family nuclease